MFYFGPTLPIAEKILQYSPGKRGKLNFELNEELFLFEISHVPISSKLFSKSGVMLAVLLPSVGDSWRRKVQSLEREALN